MDFACQVFATNADFISANCDCESLDADEITGLLEDASDLLAFMSSGRVTGRCSATIRPCRNSACGWWRPWRSWETWGTWNCCCGADSVPLAEPLVSVDLVVIDGIVLPSGDYKVINHHELVRTDGHHWPGCQDVSKDLDEEGTWGITYTFGARVPIFAKFAAIELACALSKGILPPGRQQLPPSTTFAIHQGVQLGFGTRAGAVKDVAITLPYVQQFLALYGETGMDTGFVYAPEMYDGWSFTIE